MNPREPRRSQSVLRAGATLDVRIRGDGPPLLFLHGLLANGARADAEAPDGFTVATYDQRGHGGGPRFVEPAAYAVTEFVLDALAVLDALDWSTACLGGESMGAAVALRLALDHPDRVDTLLLVAPAYSDSPIPGSIRFHEELADEIETHGVSRAAERLRESMISRGFPSSATDWLEDWQHHDTAALAAVVRGTARWAPFPDLESIGGLAIPMAVLAWPNDPVHPLELAERIGTLGHAETASLEGVAQALADPDGVSTALTRLSRSLRSR